MIFFKLSDEFIECESGYGAEGSVTRYHGEHWSLVASDLLCGVADVFQDVGIVVTGAAKAAPLEGVKAADAYRWVSIDASDKRFKSVWSYSASLGWLFVPNCREAVEDAMEWTVWADIDSEDAPRSTVFLGYRAFRDALESRVWSVENGDLTDLIDRLCIQRSLFHFKYEPALWRLFPGIIERNHLLRLADPVVSRINAENSE
jgi:hypothetical protein